MKKSRSSWLPVTGIHSPVLVLLLSAGTSDSQDGNGSGPWHFHHPNTHLVKGKLIPVAYLLCEQSVPSVLILSPHSPSVMHHILFFFCTITHSNRLDKTVSLTADFIAAPPELKTYC